MENYGFIPTPPAPTDYIAGDGQIAFQEVNPSGSWEQDLPLGEAQNSVYFDTMACVSYSANNCIETQLNFMIRTGTMPAEHLKFLIDEGYIENGKVNLCDRFLAKVSETTKQGNSMQKVADAFRHCGAIPEKDWSYPREQRTPVFEWDDYYAEIPQELLEKGKRFVYLFFEVNYEWILVDAQRHLKHAPLQVAVQLCPDWYDGDVQVCGSPSGWHAIELWLRDAFWRIFDTYSPFKKVLADGYSVPFVLKIIIKPRKKYMFELWQAEGAGDVYLIRDGHKTLFRGPKTFELVGEWSRIKKVPQAQLDSLPERFPGLELGLTAKE